ncbi:Alpha/beta superfamily hydrolase [Halanaeroarchaeum sp. HSR-CO]|uniref:alpha/beta hydrolase n=1 Tax=Halanaeroarchaeum sp. HSR-CO TaxID=2866382 RepID=UPI00217F1634|nr:alpha/beta hydrolase [Halanaeroarchaeum sp. HSR-CO]UWG48782.1 Alpha/beta superfamily hydrolase [Halanaeroarchaeum sp. HSR-CO]
MADTTVLVPGARTVESSLDEPTDGTDVCVVACPPHPQHGGHRGDRRLLAVSDYLVEHGIAVLRFDYGEWDDGEAEREDVRNALRWAADRYDRVGLFGFSFGGAMAALAAASTPVDLCGVALLGPAAQVADDLDATATLEAIDTPLRLVYGTRDTTAEWKPFYRAAEALENSIESIEGDHFFVGQSAAVAAAVGEFLADHCDDVT